MTFDLSADKNTVTNVNELLPRDFVWLRQRSLPQTEHELMIALSSLGQRLSHLKYSLYCMYASKFLSLIYIYTYGVNI